MGFCERRLNVVCEVRCEEDIEPTVETVDDSNYGFTSIVFSVFRNGHMRGATELTETNRNVDFSEDTHNVLPSGVISQSVNDPLEIAQWGKIENCLTVG